MFTVLIQNQKTMKSFYDHLPLFHSCMEEKRIDVCAWDEKGWTIEEALPDLHELTDDKGRWRAVIVRYEDDSCMAAHPFVEDNPFDFLENRNGTSLGLSDNPLIRLTQLLTKPLEYTDKERRDSQDPDRRSRFKGIYPETLTIVSVRNIDELLDLSQATDELQVGDFADRNGYPSACRFAIVDRYDQGAKRKIEDDFKFWALVLMVGRNRMDSSMMRAYALHRLDCLFDKEAMLKVWQEKCRALKQTIVSIDHSIKNRAIYLEEHPGEYPDYRVKVEGIPLKKEEIPQIDQKLFSQFSNDPSEQAAQWKQETERIKRRLSEMYEEVPEEVQKQISVLNNRVGYDQKDVLPLSQLQREKLQNELQDLNIQIMQESVNLPSLRFEQNEELEKACEEAALKIKHRIVRPFMAKWVLGFCAAEAWGLSTGWLATFFGVYEGFFYLSGLSALLMAAPPGIAWYLMRQDRKQIQWAVNRWSELMNEQFNRLRESRADYAAYLSDMLSYRNGNSYLLQAQAKVEAQKEAQRKLEALQHELEGYLNRLYEWAAGLGLAVKKDLEIKPSLYIPDTEDEDAVGELFILEPDQYQRCEVQLLGKSVASPFSFIQKLSVQALGRRDA